MGPPPPFRGEAEQKPPMWKVPLGDTCLGNVPLSSRGKPTARWDSTSSRGARRSDGQACTRRGAEKPSAPAIGSRWPAPPVPGMRLR